MEPPRRGFLAGNRKPEPESPGPSSRARSDDFARKLYFTPADFEIVERVTTLAGRRGVTPAQVALAWLVRQPGVTAPIVGTSRPEQLDQLVAALDITLDEEERGFLEERYVPHEVLGHS